MLRRTGWCIFDRMWDMFNWVCEIWYLCIFFFYIYMLLLMRMGLISVIKGPPYREVKSLHHDVLPSFLPCHLPFRTSLLYLCMHYEIPDSHLYLCMHCNEKRMSLLYWMKGFPFGEEKPKRIPLPWYLPRPYSILLHHFTFVLARYLIIHVTILR